MKLRALAKVFGGLLVILGGLITIPGFISLVAGYAHTDVFLLTGASSIIIGAVCWLLQKDLQLELSHRLGFAIVTMAWVVACVVGALPYYISGALITFTDALFESGSGFSGTGASVVTDIQALDAGILLWRAMTQWLGGMGIVVFFIAILPILGFEGIRLFNAETTGPSADKLTPRVRETAKRLWIYYLIVTGVLTALLWIEGMSFLDATCHAMTTTATGGFSTKNAGVAHFDSIAIDYTLSLFMILASINSALVFRLFVRKDRLALYDSELKWYALFCTLALIVLVGATLGEDYESFGEAFRYSLFTMAATASSTGFSHADYAQWVAPAQFTIFLLMFMGGMSGSTAGGIKCIRIMVACKFLIKELKQIVHPHAILPLKVSEQTVSDSVLATIWGFLALYFLTFVVATLLLLSFSNLDIMSASSATISVLSNIGPALGSLGPTENYASLRNEAKLILTGCMILGRLEFYTVLVLFTKEYWKS